MSLFIRDALGLRSKDVSIGDLIFDRVTATVFCSKTGPCAIMADLSKSDPDAIGILEQKIESNELYPGSPKRTLRFLVREGVGGTFYTKAVAERRATLCLNKSNVSFRTTGLQTTKLWLESESQDVLAGKDFSAAIQLCNILDRDHILFIHVVHFYQEYNQFHIHRYPRVLIRIGRFALSPTDIQTLDELARYSDMMLYNRKYESKTPLDLYYPLKYHRRSAAFFINTIGIYSPLSSRLRAIVSNTSNGKTPESLLNMLDFMCSQYGGDCENTSSPSIDRSVTKWAFLPKDDEFAFARAGWSSDVVKGFFGTVEVSDLTGLYDRERAIASHRIVPGEELTPITDDFPSIVPGEMELLNDNLVAMGPDTELSEWFGPAHVFPSDDARFGPTLITASGVMTIEEVDTLYGSQMSSLSRKHGFYGRTDALPGQAGRTVGSFMHAPTLVSPGGHSLYALPGKKEFPVIVPSKDAERVLSDLRRKGFVRIYGKVTSGSEESLVITFRSEYRHHWNFRGGFTNRNDYPDLMKSLPFISTAPPMPDPVTPYTDHYGDRLIIAMKLAIQHYNSGDGHVLDIGTGRVVGGSWIRPPVTMVDPVRVESKWSVSPGVTTVTDRVENYLNSTPPTKKFKRVFAFDCVHEILAVRKSLQLSVLFEMILPHLEEGGEILFNAYVHPGTGRFDTHSWVPTHWTTSGYDPELCLKNDVMTMLPHGWSVTKVDVFKYAIPIKSMFLWMTGSLPSPKLVANFLSYLKCRRMLTARRL
jgi:hypothetical protein